MPTAKGLEELGPEAFTYEVLEEKEADDVTDMRWELKQMEILVGKITALWR